MVSPMGSDHDLLNLSRDAGQRLHHCRHCGYQLNTLKPSPNGEAVGEVLLLLSKLE